MSLAIIIATIQPKDMSKEIESRFINQARLADYFGKSPAWISENLSTLYEQGMPRKVKLLGGFDILEIDAWLDSLSSQTQYRAIDGLEPRSDWSKAHGKFK